MKIDELTSMRLDPIAKGLYATYVVDDLGRRLLLGVFSEQDRIQASFNRLHKEPVDTPKN